MSNSPTSARSAAQATPDAPASLKREAIVDAAMRVFLALGYEGVSMELVANEAGAARRTVYNQFESKEALFEAAVERIWRDFPIVQIAADAAALDDAEQGLLRLGHAVADFWMPPSSIALIKMVVSESARFPELPKRFFEAGKAPAMKVLVGYLRELDERGALRVPHAELAAKQFLGLINESLLWPRVLGLAVAPGKAERTRVVEQAVAMFLDHYRP
ncbi:TetR/AcrR family transcriptional regulator [Trinickia fusca]|uniref:TetR/AcrR family transcriptional regulator n=1 Tax=Trinickia fusca TaxID=2419777 RepID=A0A494XEV4_9BURK|nr:TetR/AcrR family transcriptional regulator [Trinickia fusca]RKP49327.1 TetR/AcrR family transcriptional regulator [Trinickia fusca]